MRTILFRAKRKLDGEWVYGIPSPDGKQFIMNCNNEFFTIGEIDPETVGQYTGLKDKNGKNIFDGDIVQIQTSDGQILVRFVLTSIPILEDGKKKDGIAAFDPSYKIVFHENKVCKVIGNYSDNPELWEKEVKNE